MTVRIKQLTFSIWLLCPIIFCFAVDSSHAQDIDTSAPVIELEELAEGFADRTQVFTAQVAEDNYLKDVTLYYRRAGQLPFTPAPMEAISTTGFFSVSIPTDYNDLRTIEYYIQAQDLAGNRTVSGYAFDPYQRTLSQSPSPLPPADNPSQPVASNTIQEKPPLLQRRWIQVTLGVIAAGAVAALAQSGGGEDREEVSLTFNLQ